MKSPGARRRLSTIVRVDHRAHGVDREIEPARDLAIRRLEPLGARGLCVEIGGELGAVGAERVHLRGERVLAGVGLAPALGGRLERVERGGKAPACSIDRARIGHGRLRLPAVAAPPSRMFRLSKELRIKTYVL